MKLYIFLLIKDIDAEVVVKVHVDNSSEVSSIRSIYGWHFFRQIVWLLIPGGGNSNIFLEFSPRFVGENDPI